MSIPKKIAAKFIDWKQNVRENVEIIFCAALVIISVVMIVHYKINDMNQIRIVENPTFAGEVVGKEIHYVPPWGEQYTNCI